MKKMSKIFDMFFKIFLPVAMFLLAFMITFQTFLRYAVHRPLLSMDELLLIPSLGLYFFGSIWATRNEAHMNARLLEIFIKKEKTIAKIRALSALVGVVISSWLTYWAYDMLKYSMRIKKLSVVLNYRLTIVEIMPLICFSFMTLLMLFELKKYLMIAFKKEDKGD